MPDAEARRAVEVRAERVRGGVGRVWHWETERRRVVVLRHCGGGCRVWVVEILEVYGFRRGLGRHGWGFWGVMGNAGVRLARCGVRLR